MSNRIRADGASLHYRKRVINSPTTPPRTAPARAPPRVLPDDPGFLHDNPGDVGQEYPFSSIAWPVRPPRTPPTRMPMTTGRTDERREPLSALQTIRCRPVRPCSPKEGAPAGRTTRCVFAGVGPWASASVYGKTTPPTSTSSVANTRAMRSRLVDCTTLLLSKRQNRCRREIASDIWRKILADRSNLLRRP